MSGARWSPGARRNAKRVAAAALVGTAAWFLGRRIVTDLDQLRTFEWTFRPLRLALSTAVLAAVLFWGVLVWQGVLRICGLRVPFRALARAWFLSNLSRYIPGVVWQFLTLAQLGPAFGLTPAVTVMSLMVQMGFLLLSGAALGVWMLPAEMAGVLAPALPALRLASPLVVAAVHPRVIGAGLGLVGRVTKRAMPEWGGSWASGVRMLLVCGVSWWLYGAAFFLFLTSFVDLPLTALPAIVATNALAWIVGYVVVIAPAGAGFKEAALGVLLAGLMPQGVAAALAVAARLWTIAAEALPALALVAFRGARAPAAPEPGGE